MAHWRKEDVTQGNYLRVLRQATEFGDTFNTVLGHILDRIEAMPVPNLPEADHTPARVDPNVEAENERVVDALVGTSHGPEGLWAVRVQSPYEVADPAGEVPRRVSRTVLLPIGAPLMARYKGKVYNAMITARGIEYGGRYFENPSKAAVAAKADMGVEGKAAQTNGWLFWYIEKPAGSGLWSALASLRDHQLGQLGPNVE